MNGWIKLHYKLIDWEWLDCPEMVSLWVNLLLRVNRTEKRWHGITIARGQMVTTRSELAKMCGLSEQKVRTCIERLKSTNEITSESTNAGTVITVLKYDNYQSDADSDQPANQPADQPTSNQRSTNRRTPYLFPLLRRVNIMKIERKKEERKKLSLKR